MYELPKTIERSRNVLFAASRGWRRKREAVYVALRECGSQKSVTVQGLQGLNALLSAIFRVEYLIPQIY